MNRKVEVLENAKNAKKKSKQKGSASQKKKLNKTKVMKQRRLWITHAN
jgi:hypothetical protein